MTSSGFLGRRAGWRSGHRVRLVVLGYEVSRYVYATVRPDNEVGFVFVGYINQNRDASLCGIVLKKLADLLIKGRKRLLHSSLAFDLQVFVLALILALHRINLL